MDVILITNRLSVCYDGDIDLGADCIFRRPSELRCDEVDLVKSLKWAILKFPMLSSELPNAR